ncbi:Ras protein Rab-18-B [Fasciola gigantica]|nr:Ras protein Rab-18-B [Fasciola gigantica]
MDELKTFSNYADMVQMLVGNKIDQRPRQVTREEGIRFGRLYNMSYSEASAKTSEGVNSLFFDLVTRIYAKPSLWDPDNRRYRTTSSSRLQLNQSKPSGSGCC